MPITGAWKEQKEIQAGARIWGSGWNPVHAIPDSYGGRNIAPEGMVEGERDWEVIDLNAPYTTYETDPPPEVPYFGYGPQNGTSERPPYNHSEYRNNRGTADDFPRLDENGDQIRDIDKGGTRRTTSKSNFMDETFDDWNNKLNTEVTDAQPSPETYEMQTSMVQRDKVRNMSQTTGRASTYAAPIASRIIGEKLKTLVGSRERLFDMFPRQQSYMVRPFWQRNAGTDLPQKMAPNATYISIPLQRVPPGDPWQGTSLAGSGDGYYNNDWTVGYDQS